VSRAESGFPGGTGPEMMGQDPTTGVSDMPPALEALGLDRLTVAERIELVAAIWDSIAADVERAPLTDAQKQEVDRRLAAHRANPQAAIPWEQVEAEALARLRK
jgi:putative addiction module component (TIGR02574 family)